MSLSHHIQVSLAVIDSGVGGVSVLTELRQILPHNSMLYYADSAHCPYGLRSADQVIELTQRVVECVVDRGVRVVVVACNTMTTSAIGALRARWGEIKFVGMEPAIKPAAINSSTGVVGVLATKATLNGDLYLHSRDQYAANVKVVEVAGVGLVEYVERGLQDSVECESLLRFYVEQIIEQGADCIVLGCTHYPFLEPAMRRIIGGRDVTIINPAGAVARRTFEVMTQLGLVSGHGVGQLEYMTSGSDEDLGRLSSFLDSVKG